MYIVLSEGDSKRKHWLQASRPEVTEEIPAPEIEVQWSPQDMEDIAIWCTRVEADMFGTSDEYDIHTGCWFYQFHLHLLYVFLHV